MTFELTSTAFAPWGAIPGKYTCDGEDISPPLQWSDPPQGAQSLALICDDPDAPMGTWTHWLIYDIPGNQSGLPEGVPATEALQGGTKQGLNSWPRIGYGGPSPPPGKPHRYFFRLYALNGMLDLPPGADKKTLLKAMEGKILAQAEFHGTYGRKR